MVTLVAKEYGIVEKLAMQVLALYEWALLVHGVRLKISDGRRSCAEQDRLYQESIRTGVIATRATCKTGKHVQGKAIHLTAPMSFVTKELGPASESIGLRWGGRWKDPYDPLHFEIPT